MSRSKGSALRAPSSPPSVSAAFDALRFGRENTLDLRSSLPTAADAAYRAESFLRERQIAGAAEVLVVTGRGNQSDAGVAVVRPAVARVLARLRRQGVVSAWQEHTAGSFVVEPAAIHALFEAPRRRGDVQGREALDTQALAGLDAATHKVLRELAVRTLQELGAPAGESFVLDEMQHQFSALSQSIPPGPDREARLCAAAAAALAELDDAV